MKKKFIVGIIIGAVVIFAAGCSFGEAGNNRASTRVQQNTTQNSDDSKQDDTQGDNSQQQQIKIVKMGEVGQIENADLKIVNISTKQSVSDEFETEHASGKYIVVELSMKNTSDSPIQYSNYEFALGANKKIYESGDSASDAATSLNSKETIDNNNNDFVHAVDSFNPGMTKKTYVVFDVPKDFDVNQACLAVAGDNHILFKIGKSN